MNLYKINQPNFKNPTKQRKLKKLSTTTRSLEMRKTRQRVIPMVVAIVMVQVTVMARVTVVMEVAMVTVQAINGPDLAVILHLHQQALVPQVLMTIRRLSIPQVLRQKGFK